MLGGFQVAVRKLFRSPAFSLTLIASLALGIGVTTALWSIVDAILLKPLGLAEEANLAAFYLYRTDSKGFPYTILSYADWQDFRDRKDLFEDIVLATNNDVAFRRGQDVERLSVEVVSENYFRVLGVPMQAGRGFREDDREPVAVVHPDLCSDCLGKTLMINARAFTVIGITKREFHGTSWLNAEKAWLPLSQHQILMPIVPGILTQRRLRWFSAIARVRNGISLTQAEAGARITAEALAQKYPESRGYSVAMVPLDNVRTPLFDRQKMLNLLKLLAALGCFVLLMTCANVASLLLARGAERQREFSLRAALGASRSRLIGELMIENGVVGLAGAALGLALHAATLSAFEAIPNSLVPGLSLHVNVDGRVLIACSVISCLIVLLTGLLPSLAITRGTLSLNMEGKGSVSGRANLRLLRAIVAGQVGLCFALLLSAGLFVSSLRNLLLVNPGFQYQNVLTMSLDLGQRAYSAAHGRAFYRNLTSRLRALPGVLSVSFGLTRPLEPSQGAENVWLHGRELSAPGMDVLLCNWITPWSGPLG